VGQSQVWASDERVSPVDVGPRTQSLQILPANSGTNMRYMLSAKALDTLPLPIQERLGTDDDPRLWREVLRAAAEDASVLGCSELYAIVGCCSHWLRPHQSRWTAAGGFALPVGYGGGEGFLRGLPNLDWRVILQFDHAQLGWALPSRPPTKGFNSVRLAVPSRTARHRQAAVHAVWSPLTSDTRRKRTDYYGFRKSEGGWCLVAHYQRGEGVRRTSTTIARPSE